MYAAWPCIVSRLSSSGNSRRKPNKMDKPACSGSLEAVVMPSAWKYGPLSVFRIGSP